MTNFGNISNRHYCRLAVYRTRHIKARLKRIIDKMPHLFPQDKRRILALFGIEGHCGHIPLSDLAAREEALRILYRCIGAFFTGLSADTLIFHGTFTDAIGNTTDREAHFRLRALRGKVDRAIRQLGLNALVVFEVQAVTNYPGRGLGYCLMLHAHAILWGNVDGREIDGKIPEINKSRAWSNDFRAPPIKLRRLHMEGCEAQYIGSYILKPPYSAVRLIRKPWGWRFTPVLNYYRDHLLLRIMEGLSSYSIYEAVAGVGDGKFIRKRWKSELEQWHRDRVEREPSLPAFNFPVPWKRIRRHYHHRGHYKPFRIE